MSHLDSTRTVGTRNGRIRWAVATTGIAAVLALAVTGCGAQASPDALENAPAAAGSAAAVPGPTVLQYVVDDYGYGGNYPALQTVTVPDGVTGVHIVAVGGWGGDAEKGIGTFQWGTPGTGGAPAQVSGDIAVSPGQQFTVRLGNCGWNGCKELAYEEGLGWGGLDGTMNGNSGGGVAGAGGGATGIAFGGTTVIVAGGGGGGGTNGGGWAGGPGGGAGPVAGSGVNGNGPGAGAGGAGGPESSPPQGGTGAKGSKNGGDSGGGGGGVHGGSAGAPGGTGGGGGGGGGAGSSMTAAPLTNASIVTASSRSDQNHQGDGLATFTWTS